MCNLNNTSIFQALYFFALGCNLEAFCHRSRQIQVNFSRCSLFLSHSPAAIFFKRLLKYILVGDWQIIINSDSLV